MIENLLSARSARLLWGGSNPASIAHRLYVSKRIASMFPLFEDIRDGLMGTGYEANTAETRAFLNVLQDFGIASLDAGEWRASDAEARRYLTGGWLEEYVAAATEEAGADEVYCGQKVGWQVGQYQGENEIDVLARFGDRLFFCSCKALKSRLDPHDGRTRERLTAALHEADNLADHFAPDRAVVALAVTTDLFDERVNHVRYEPLHGKAVALGVNILSAEKLNWSNLVREIGGYFR